MDSAQFDFSMRAWKRTHSRRRVLLGAGAVLAGALVATPPAAVPAVAQGSPVVGSPAPGTSIKVHGQVATPLVLTLADLQALATETTAVTYRAEDGANVTHRYTGARLWDAIQLAHPVIDPTQPESALRLYLVLTARDGYVVVLSLGEIDPEFGGQPYLLAWAEDGQALTGARAPVMLVPPGDQTEGRYIFGLTTIEVRTIA